MKLIDKSALVAEIEKQIELLKPFLGACAGQIVAEANAKLSVLEGLKILINTLEVKEVDLEKEIKEQSDKYYSQCEKKLQEMDDNDKDLSFLSLDNFAKHFFELGLKARTDKELVEEVYSHLDSIKDTADRMTSGNFMHNKAAIKFSANTISKVLELIGLKAQKGE